MSGDIVPGLRGRLQTHIRTAIHYSCQIKLLQSSGSNEMQITDKIWTGQEEDRREETSLRQRGEAFTSQLTDKNIMISNTRALLLLIGPHNQWQQAGILISFILLLYTTGEAVQKYTFPLEMLMVPRAAQEPWNLLQKVLVQSTFGSNVHVWLHV